VATYDVKKSPGGSWMMMKLTTETKAMVASAIRVRRKMN
jgi:hypothetical protein